MTKYISIVILLFTKLAMAEAFQVDNAFGVTAETTYKQIETVARDLKKREYTPKIPYCSIYESSYAPIKGDFDYYLYEFSDKTGSIMYMSGIRENPSSDFINSLKSQLFKEYNERQAHTVKVDKIDYDLYSWELKNKNIKSITLQVSKLPKNRLSLTYFLQDDKSIFDGCYK